MTDDERLAFRARTRRIGWLLALLGAALTVMAVQFKLPFTGTAALLVVFGGSFWVGRRYLVVRLTPDPTRPRSR